MDAIFGTRKPLDKARWQAIVIHHSATPSGKPDALDALAREQGLKELGYHFVIGNGNGMGDGELHVGARWLKQVPGAHAAGSKADWYNLNSIGVCVIGDGDRQSFTDDQLARLGQLVNSLSRELGIPTEKIVLHREIARTTSPGRLFPENAFRESLSNGR